MGWDAEFADHQRAVAEYIAAARNLDEATWQREAAPGKWSPAEISEHLVMAYTILRAELGGGQGIRPRMNWWRRIVLRVIYLPGLLRTGRMPRPVMAPREVRPTGGPFAQRATLARLAEESEALMRELAERPAARLTHPFFGKLSAAQAVRFCAVHTRHHIGQLPGSTTSADGFTPVRP